VAEVLLGVSGGIAAYKALDVLRMLQRKGHGVSVVMTRAATRFVGPQSFAALSGRTVGTRMFAAESVPDYAHLDLSRAADLMLVAPASANTIARLAAGMADDLLTACALALTGPLVVAPAMNTRMLENPATAENLERLRARGVHVVPPGSGLLADGERGPGRLADPAQIVSVVDGLLAGGGAWRGRRVLVSAGGTREPIDAVRFVGNRSSGRMGLALAEAAVRRGAEVTVIAANVDLPRTAGVRYVDVATAEDLRAAARREFPSCDLLVMAAAVADFRPVAAAPDKIAKAGRDGLELTLEPTADVLAELAGRRNGQVLVGFAAEHGPEGLARAREKRTRKGLDVIVHNDVAEAGIGFESGRNAVTIIGPGDREEHVGPASKAACAEAILDAVAPLLGPSPDGGGRQPGP
jgi:phosphopantothenoylcysteine decarboxylase / phosphopantothenate---cysteine ligase